ncbi:MAG: hypothetical protein IPM35_15180 [Myxococcales bacterium]|nr:hypothetical protein [Myxococcales bacterium]
MAHRTWYRRRVLGFAALGSALLPACGPSDAADAADSGADGPVDASGLPDGAALPSCTASQLGGAVAAAQAGEVCTTVLRISEKETLYSVSCGPVTTVTQGAAEALFTDPPHGPPYWALAKDALPEAYVFFHDPMDSGGVAVVSAQTGLLAARVKTACCVGGTPSGGSIADPPQTSWTVPSACRTSVALPSAKGLLLGGGQVPSSGPLDPSAIAEAMQQLGDTPLADELAKRATIELVLVLDNPAAGRFVVLESSPLGP